MEGNRLAYFGWLLDGIVNHVLFWCPAGALLLIALVTVRFSDPCALSRLGRPGALLALFTPSLTGLLALAVGTLCEHGRCSGAGEQAAVALVYGLLLYSLLLGLALVVRAGGVRLFVIAVCLPQIWFCCLACFVSLMSIAYRATN
jgi:hypothetical protein